MKIPFDIKYRPQIESGEYKVIDRFGYVLTLRDIINDAWYFSLRYPNTDYETERIYDHPENHLFLVTPEEELTEFEKACMKLYDEGRDDGLSGDKLSNESVKESAAELLSLAINARAKELSDGLKQSKLDKDSTPYHLIEFMCNLYDCQNWKEIEETAEAYVTRIKAASMKDLPRWRKYSDSNNRGYGIHGGLLLNGDWLIELDGLEKLPKEDDSHE